jgi:tRNA-dihydrouridine synthase B
MLSVVQTHSQNTTQSAPQNAMQGATISATQRDHASSFPLFDKPLVIGRHQLANRVFVAPMAGVTDRPYRQLCRGLGAGYAVSEMAASNALLWATEKTSRRINHDGEPAPKAVQIAGSDAYLLAEAALFNANRGADIIDINMGCPAKKVCNKAAGSALMQDEKQVVEILRAVVKSLQGTNVPVTLKMRTGYSRTQRNAVQLARIAEAEGIAMVTIHGRTREDQYRGHAEYDTIAQVKSAVGIPVVANGDIDSGPKALAVLKYTGADAVMIGRAAQGRPWLAGHVAHFLASGEARPPPSLQEMSSWLRSHLLDHYAFYGELKGVRSARKHIGWYLQGLPGVRLFRETIFQAETAEDQLAAIDQFLLRQGLDRAA